MVEIGYLGGTDDSGSASLDYMAAWQSGTSCLRPFVVAGYTRLFRIGNALNLGGGFDLPLAGARGLRFELRDYHSSGRSDIGFRIGLVFYISD